MFKHFAVPAASGITLLLTGVLHSVPAAAHDTRWNDRASVTVTYVVRDEQRYLRHRHELDHARHERRRHYDHDRGRHRGHDRGRGHGPHASRHYHRDSHHYSSRDRRHEYRPRGEAVVILKYLY